MGMNPVAWRGASGGEATIKELTADELKELAYRVLSKIANTNGVGTVNVSTNTSLTLVGTFDDTFRGANTTGATNTEIGTTTYTLRQNLTTDYPESIPPNFYYAANTAYPLTESNTSVYETLANNILYYCTFDEGPNSYRIDTTSPAVTYGGTWEIVTSITDSLYASTVDTTTYNLYKRVDDGGYTPQRPLKTGASNGTLNQFTDADITNIARIVRQRIKDTGLANYSFGETAPVTGTWSAVGTVIDRISDTEATYTTAFSTPVAYDTDYIGDLPYTSTYYGPVEYAIDYTSQIIYSGPVDYLGPGPSYVGDDAIAFFGNALYTGSYFGPQSFDDTAVPYDSINPDALPAYYATYFGPLSAGYVGDNGTPFNIQYIGDNVAEFYAVYQGPLPATYLGPSSTTYFGPASFVNPNATPFSSPTYFGPASFTGPPTPVSYIGDNATPFTGPGAPVGYVRTLSYVGPKGTFSTNVTYTGPGSPTTYLGPASFTGTVPGPSFINPNANPFSATYLGPASFINPDANPFVGTNPNGTPFFGTLPDGGGFTSPTYYGPFPFLSPTYLGPALYLGTLPDGNPFDLIPGYAGPFPVTYIGTASYINENAVQYDRDFAGSVPYLGPATFIDVDAIPYTNENATPFASPFISYTTGYINDDGATFTGPIYTADPIYTTTYTGSLDYLNDYLSSTDYTGPGGTYVAPGIVLGTSTTVITKYLWRRVA